MCYLTYEQHRRPELKQNKHSVSIAKQYMSPTGPNKFSRIITPTTADQKGQKVISSQ